MDSDQKLTTPLIPQPISTTLLADTTPEPQAAPTISRSTPLAEGLRIKTPISAPLPPPSSPTILPSPSGQTTILPASAILSPTASKISSSQTTDNKIDLEKELSLKTFKYSIRTMAQDLERARKESISPNFGVKIPTMPPPPPLRTLAPRETTETPIPPSIPSAPTVKMTEVPPAAAPIPSAPIVPSMEPSVIPPPAKKLSRISFAHLNLIIIIASVAIIFIGSLGFSYWWFFVREAPIKPVAKQPQIEEEKPKEGLPPDMKEPALPEGIIVPEGIILIDQEIIIETSEKSPSDTLTSSLLSQISKSAKTLGDKKLARVLIKYSSETEKQYLSFVESLTLLNLTTPDSFIKNISGGEILAYGQNGEIRYGLAAKTVNAVKIIDIMKDWEKTLVSDLKNIYMEKTPAKLENATFQDFSYESFIVRYLNLPTPDVSMTWGVSDAEKTFVIATSKDMMYKIIGYTETEKPVLRTFPSGTLVRAKGDTKIYRVIDDKKLWIPTVKAFINSGYPVRSEIEILPEELAQYQDVKYIKLKDAADIYEIKGDKKYLVTNPQTLPQNEIKISSYAEFIAYPVGQ